MLLGDFVIGTQSFFNNGGTITTCIAIFVPINFKKDVQDFFVDVYGDIDNIIKVDFLGSFRNLHFGFTFFVVDSTDYEGHSYCTSALEGKAFLLAA